MAQRRIEPLTEMLNGFVKQFYDEAKGGVQIGGWIGGLAGALAAYKMTEGFGLGLLGMAGGALLIGLGAWGGKQAGNALMSRNNSPTRGVVLTPPALGKDIPLREVSHARASSPSISTLVNPAKEPSLNDPLDVTVSTGGFSPPATHPSQKIGQLPSQNLT